MKLETIQELWHQDCKIDTTDISKEASNIPSLHEKYYKIYIGERLQLYKLQADYKKLKLEKYEFLINPTEEDVRDKGWKIPDRGRILRQEVSGYLEGDSDMINKELQIGIQQEKVEFIKSIIDSISKRGFLLKTIHDDRKFMSGG
jgi:hypothetical protein